MLPYTVLLLRQDTAARCQVFCCDTVYFLGCPDARCIIGIHCLQAITCHFLKQASLCPAVGIFPVTEQVAVGIIGEVPCLPLHGNRCQLVFPCAAIGKSFKDSPCSFRSALCPCRVTAHFRQVAAGIVLIAEIQLLIWVIFTGQLSLGIIGISMAVCTAVFCGFRHIAPGIISILPCAAAVFHGFYTPGLPTVRSSLIDIGCGMLAAISLNG